MNLLSSSYPAECPPEVFAADELAHVGVYLVASRPVDGMDT
jgi:hypothetical protein